MNRKKLPEWLWGGIIGGIISVLMYAGYLFGFKIMLSSLSNPYPNVPIFIKWFSAKMFFLLSFGFGTGGVYIISKFIIILILCLILGALIGWIIGKIKHKK